MIKFPFTPVGVAGMCQHFYQKDDQELAIEADSLNNNFQAWVLRNFELSISQEAYLQEINVDVVAFMASNSSLALRNRLPIILVKPEGTALRDSKITKPKSNLTAEILPDGEYEADGEFEVEISD